MVLAQEIAVALEDRGATELLYGQLLPFGHLVALSPGTIDGSLSRSLGSLHHLTGRLDEAETHLLRALDVHRRMAAALKYAHTQLDYADVLRRSSGGSRSGSDLVGQALEAAQRVGYGALERRAGAFLSSVPPDLTSGPSTCRPRRGSLATGSTASIDRWIRGFVPVGRRTGCASEAHLVAPEL